MSEGFNETKETVADKKPGSLIFSTGGVSAPPTERMRIDPDGNFFWRGKLVTNDDQIFALAKEFFTYANIVHDEETKEVSF